MIGGFYMFGSNSNSLFHAGVIDYLVIIIYFVFVLGIGFYLRKHMKTGKDFFLSGRSIPTWITGLAFLSANMGALELLGFAANGVEYGAMAAHFYFIGAVPAMIFLGVFMMPFYYATKIRSVPEYLKLRYNEATRGLNAVAFAVMTVLVSGISLYSMGLIFHTLIGWSLTMSILFSAIVVLLYVGLGGLTSSIYNEVVQFFLIWLGLLPVAFLGLHEVGGWHGIVEKLPDGFTHLWAASGSAGDNPMGITWIGMILGLGFVLAFGYWTTDFSLFKGPLPHGI